MRRWTLGTAAAACVAQLIVLAVSPSAAAAIGLAIVAGLAAALLAARRPVRRAPVPSPSLLAPLADGRWERLAEECVALIDEFDRLMPDFGPQQREVADHAVSRLREILERSGVEPIDGDAAFDRHHHRPDCGSAVAGDHVVETLSPGFRIGPRVLRRARVRIDRTPAADHGAHP